MKRNEEIIVQKEDEFTNEEEYYSTSKWVVDIKGLENPQHQHLDFPWG